MQGGSGKDGDAQLAWIDPVEMGGTLLLEASGVTLANGSAGMLAGFFGGEQTQPGCTAGFQVTAQQGTGAVSVQPFVMGSPTGSMYPINPANQYALRVRVHCPECERGLALYRSFTDSGAISYGGQWNNAPAKLLFEIQEFVNGVAGMPITLYDGQIASLPGACTVVAASSINLVGSMRALNLTNLGSGWVVTTPAERRSSHAPDWLNLPGRRVPHRKHRQTGLLSRLRSARRRADLRQLSRRWQISRTQREHLEPTISRAGRLAVSLRMDRLGDQSRAAQFVRLPQRCAGNATGSRQRKRTLERDIQMRARLARR